MYLLRSQISQLYEHLQRNVHPLSSPVLLLTALNVDALCATRIFTALLKRDYIPHKVQPVSGYAELQRAGQDLVLPLSRQQGGDGGVVICIGVGGLVDLEEILGLDGAAEDGSQVTDMSNHGVDVWVIDAHRPWNLNNVFGAGAVAASDGHHSRKGVDQGCLQHGYTPGGGGIIVWDDGTIEQELIAEKKAYMALRDMPDITEQDVDVEYESDASDDVDVAQSTSSRKRKASQEEDEDDVHSERPSRRRRSNSSMSIPASPTEPTSGQVLSSAPPQSSQQELPQDLLPSSPPKAPSARQLRKELLRLRRKHESTLEKYYSLGMTSSEPTSSIAYSLASEMGREDNDQLWLAIVGISSLELSPFSQPQTDRDTNGKKLLDRTEQIREILRDEVRRLNPMSAAEVEKIRSRGYVMPLRASSPTDYSIRLSPEPRFMLIRHWSLYDSMMHSPYLSTRLHLWSDAGRQRLHKLLAKMGVSLQEAGKSYLHMDMDLKQSLRQRILKFAPQYNLDGLVPGEDGRRGLEGYGFVRSWGWKATLSAVDVAFIIGAILEVGLDKGQLFDHRSRSGPQAATYNARMQAPLTPPRSDDDQDVTTNSTPDWTTNRFFAAYDALSPISSSSRQGPSLLMQHVSTAQELARAILRCGSALMAKKQIRHLRSFRLAVVKEGPDMPTFVHPGALVKLASWVSEAVQVLEAERGRRNRQDDALVVGCLDEARDVYVVVGIGGAGARKPVRSKAEIRQREERKKRRQANKMAAKAERVRKRAERRQLQREINEANGLLDSDAEDEDGSDVTESEASEESDESEEESDAELAEARRRRGYGSNRFGQAFQEVVEETGARVRIDSFEHSVVEVKKEDLSGFLEALSSKSVVG